MKKIVFILRNLKGGGAERAMVNLMKGLQNRGYKIQLCLIQSNGPFLSDIQNRIPIFTIIPEKSLAARISNSVLIHSDLIRTAIRFCLHPISQKIAQYLKTENPDYVVSCLWEADIATGKALELMDEKIPWVVAQESSVRRYLANSLLGKYRVSFSKRIYSRASAFVGCSKSNIEDAKLILDLSAEKTYFAYNGMDKDRIVQQMGESIDDLEFDPSHFNLVSIARLERVKRIDLLVEAFSIIHKRYQNTRLHILGVGRLRKELENQVQRLNLQGSVTFYGYQSNPFRVLKQSQLFLLCSDVEPFGNVVAEAMIVGTPVIATRSGGPEEVIEDGKTGLLFDLGDMNGLVKSIERMIVDSRLREDLSTRAHEFAIHNLTIENTVRCYENIFSQI